MKRRTAQFWISRALLALTLLIVLTGFGITHPSIIEPATFGLLQKSTSYWIHTLTWGPFLILLLLHIYLSFPRRVAGKGE
jgi:thiosulfate reductase cytochrome b subunit